MTSKTNSRNDLEGLLFNRESAPKRKPGPRPAEGSSQHGPKESHNGNKSVQRNERPTESAGPRPQATRQEPRNPVRAPQQPTVVAATQETASVEPVSRGTSVPAAPTSLPEQVHRSEVAPNESAGPVPGVATPEARPVEPRPEPAPTDSKPDVNSLARAVADEPEKRERTAERPASSPKKPADNAGRAQNAVVPPKAEVRQEAPPRGPAGGGPRVQKTTAPASSGVSDDTEVELQDLLEHHLRFYGFDPKDTVYVPRLLRSLADPDTQSDMQAQWVVLHKKSNHFATLTSTGELPRVARQGDTSLSLELLLLLQKKKPTIGMVKKIRALAPELFARCSHLVTLQVMTLAVLERCLDDKVVPNDLAGKVLQVVQALYTRKKREASPLLVHARALEVLAASWALGYDDEKTMELAGLTCERICAPDFMEAGR